MQTHDFRILFGLEVQYSRLLFFFFYATVFMWNNFCSYLFLEKCCIILQLTHSNIFFLFYAFIPYRI